jgi:Putative transposase
LSDDGALWHPAGKTFLFPKTALATLARARFRDAFARLCPAADLPPHVWQIPWVVHITPWGQGQQAALDYLARYAFRIAITNNRILAVDEATVPFATRTAPPTASASKPWPATSSSGASSSTSCRPASTSSAITACGMPRANRCATSGMFSCWRNPPGHRPNPHPSPTPTPRPRHRRAVARIARPAI